MSIDGDVQADEVRQALRHLVGPVSVVTTRDADRPWGMTVSAFTVVCLEPPTMALCVNRATATAAHILRTRRLGLNVLCDGQVEMSQRCAAPGESKFLDVAHVANAGAIRSDGTAAAPLLAGALVAFDCDAECLDVAGTHLLVAAKVRSVVLGDRRQPLLYGAGQYHRPSPLVPAP
jgi:flavin reductase (DIM6/NTAB) family NADH-FMN oxidoreductase RutF